MEGGGALSEYIELPSPRSLRPPRPLLDLLRDYWLEHQAKAGMTWAPEDGPATEERCLCDVCLDAAQHLGAGR